jgi:hypothetical protein
MTFDEAFKAHILNKKIIAWGFQQPTRVRLPNGFDAFPCGYFTTYENSYRLIISGELLGKTPIQEVMILDPDGIPIARDTEYIKGID